MHKIYLMKKNATKNIEEYYNSKRRASYQGYRIRSPYTLVDVCRWDEQNRFDGKIRDFTMRRSLFTAQFDDVVR